MTTPQRPIDEARGMIALFVRSDWVSCHVRGGGIELFVTRTSSHANPMLAAREESPSHALDTTTLTAPHIGTLVDLAAIDTPLRAGDRYGTIELLGEHIDLITTQGGIMRRRIGRAGALIEYGQPLATLG